MINNLHTDFSDNVMKTHSSGYGIGQVQYELLSCGTNETPLQRFVRVFLCVCLYVSSCVFMCVHASVCL